MGLALVLGVYSGPGLVARGGSWGRGSCPRGPGLVLVAPRGPIALRLIWLWLHCVIIGCCSGLKRSGFEDPFPWSLPLHLGAFSFLKS